MAKNVSVAPYVGWISALLPLFYSSTFCFAANLIDIDFEKQPSPPRQLWGISKLERTCNPFYEDKWAYGSRLGDTLYSFGDDLSKFVSLDHALDAYAFGHQAKLGDVSGRKPTIFEPVALAKYDRWASKRGMGRE